MPKFRLRGPSGQSTVQLSDADSTIQDLRNAISSNTNLEAFDIKLGYPPQPLDLDAYDASQKLSESGLNLQGQSLMVTGKKAPAAQTQSKPPVSNAAQSSSSSRGPSNALSKTAPPSTKSKPSKGTAEDPPEVFVEQYASFLVMRVMPDDNSCLFRALSAALVGSDIDGGLELRSVVAQEIQANPEKYSQLVLEQPPDDYCRWIQTPDAWGGQIEIEILARFFGVSVHSIDVQTGRVDQYNDGADLRCFLVYSGIHYDVLALVSADQFDGPSKETMQFASDDSTIEGAAQTLCDMLKAKHYYTDTSTFTIACKVCGWKGNGEREVAKHAESTGHFDFGEV